MPAPRKSEKSPTYLNLKEKCIKDGDYNFCAIIATCAVTGLDHEEVRDLYRRMGRKKKSGVATLDIIEAVESLGFKAVEIPSGAFISLYPSPHNNLRSVTTHHPERFAKVWPSGRFLLFSRGHVTGIVDGVNHDWSIGRSKRAISIYRVEKKS